MCMKSRAPKAETPAAAPAPALPAPEAPEVGERRRRESMEMFDGQDAPSYRVKKSGKEDMPQANPGGAIVM